MCVRVLTRAQERARDSEGEERRGEERREIDGVREGRQRERETERLCVYER